MAEAPARVWLRQALADHKISTVVANEQDPATFCQAISKYQQAVEKAIKAVLAALRDRGLIILPTPRGHNVNQEIQDIISALRRAPRARNIIDLLNHVQTLLNPKNAAEILELCALAPQWPGPGKLFPKNTEYPFQSAPNQWVAPSDNNVFQRKELRKYRHLANTVVGLAGKVVSAAER